MLSVLFGLLSALVWGGGDFAGGLASRRLGTFRAVLFGSVSGLGLLVGLSFFAREAPISLSSGIYAAAGGALGGVGLLILYHTFAVGQMSVAAPLSALLTAALPVIFNATTMGLAGPAQMAGFGCGMAAIWLVSQSREGFHLARPAELWLPLISGICFGGYFIGMHYAAREALLTPMIIARAAGAATALGIFLARKETVRGLRAAWKLVALNALLDVGGNALYMLASKTGRLDVAAVLSSLYPGSTVLLASIFLHERLARRQWAGIAAALAAIVLLTLGAK